MTALSPREREIVILVGRDGVPWPKVPGMIGIRIGTVRSYVARIMFKTGSQRPPREALTELYWREIHVVADADGTAAD